MNVSVKLPSEREEERTVKRILGHAELTYCGTEITIRLVVLFCVNDSNATDSL